MKAQIAKVQLATAKCQAGEIEERMHESLLGRSMRVPMRAGSVLIWNQLLFHGTSPNMGTNRCRYAQYLKAFPRRDYTTYHPPAVSGVSVPLSEQFGQQPATVYDYQGQHEARLLRRATALYDHLLRAGFFEAIKRERCLRVATGPQKATVPVLAEADNPTSIAAGSSHEVDNISAMLPSARAVFGLDVLLK